MTRLQKIEQLKELGLYSELIKGGIISISVNFWLELYYHYNTQLTINQEFRDKKTRARFETSENFKCSELTVSRAITYMNKEL